ncbi:polyketide cyclase [Gordonia sp. PKS22-38]|uniref:Polyketide cyclase n=1 Tax=Gordonia prachuapensis TaxID=3115651 RepID=A0ABU7MTD8_9ACTN|nr:polyketide cyclase [Gordonia sp. PKS22-38]
MPRENVTATLTIDVPITGVFAVLAEPSTHGAVDGTGWVRDAVDQAPLTEVGQVFRVNMYHANHPDGDYRISNQVTVIDPPKAIAWLPGQPDDNGELDFGGWFWRYDLTAIDSTTTEVTLTYDWTDVPPHIREYIQFPPFGLDHLENSLRNISRLAADFERTR